MCRSAELRGEDLCGVALEVYVSFLFRFISITETEMGKCVRRCNEKSASGGKGKVEGETRLEHVRR